MRWFCLDACAVDDVDYCAAETPRSVFAVLKEKGIGLVVDQVLGDIGEENRYNFRQLAGEDAFYETPQDVMNDYRRQTNMGLK